MSRTPSPTDWATYARELGLEVQRRRIAAGLTQEELAHRAGLTRTHYQQIEKGEWRRGSPANPSIKVLAHLARALNVQVGDLAPSVTELGQP
jgi:transcriptional regulator with XRE-family HTH domain